MSRTVSRVLVLLAVFYAWMGALLYVVDGRVDGWDLVPLVPAGLLGFFCGRWGRA